MKTTCSGTSFRIGPVIERLSSHTPMNALEAALAILAQSPEPLSKQEIAKRAIDSGIWVSSGKTPYETIGSQLYSDIKKKGKDSDFILVSPGVFTVRTPPEKSAADAAEPAQPQPAQPEKRLLREPAAPASIAECAASILDAFACQTPMTFTEMAAIAVEHGLVAETVPRPERLFEDEIQKSIRHDRHRNSTPQFFLANRNTAAGLTSWPQHPETEPDPLPLPVPPLPLLDCAQKILDAATARRPMHYRTIAAKAIEDGCLVSNSRTPDVSLYAQIITDIKQRTRKGEPPRFVRFKNGFIGLAAWTESDLAEPVRNHNRRACETLRQRLLQLSADRFDAFLTRFLAEIGFETITPLPEADDTRTVTASATLTAAAVIRIPAVIRFVRSFTTLDVTELRRLIETAPPAELLLVITTADFSPAAETEAASAPRRVALMNAVQLTALLAEHTIGIRKNTIATLEFDPDEL